MEESEWLQEELFQLSGSHKSFDDIPVWMQRELLGDYIEQIPSTYDAQAFVIEAITGSDIELLTYSISMCLRVYGRDPFEDVGERVSSVVFRYYKAGLEDIFDSVKEKPYQEHDAQSASDDIDRQEVVAQRRGKQ